MMPWLIFRENESSCFRKRKWKWMTILTTWMEFCIYLGIEQLLDYQKDPLILGKVRCLPITYQPCHHLYNFGLPKMMPCQYICQTTIKEENWSSVHVITAPPRTLCFEHSKCYLWRSHGHPLNFFFFFFFLQYYLLHFANLYPYPLRIYYTKDPNSLSLIFLTKDLSILLIKNHEHKAFTSQIIKFCKIITIWYENNSLLNFFNSSLA
jgi:hypothetical protein